jgi:hypothetical protein
MTVVRTHVCTNHTHQDRCFRTRSRRNVRACLLSTCLVYGRARAKRGAYRAWPAVTSVLLLSRALHAPPCRRARQAAGLKRSRRAAQARRRRRRDAAGWWGGVGVRCTACDDPHARGSCTFAEGGRRALRHTRTRTRTHARAHARTHARTRHPPGNKEPRACSTAHHRSCQHTHTHTAAQPHAHTQRVPLRRCHVITPRPLGPAQMTWRRQRSR